MNNGGRKSFTFDEIEEDFLENGYDEQIDDFMASMLFSYQHGTFNQTTTCDYTNNNGEIELC